MATDSYLHCYEFDRNIPLCLQEHIKDVHGRARFICDLCNKDYTLQRQLASHLVRVHDINGQELREKILQAIQSQETRDKKQQEGSNNVATSKAAAASGSNTSDGVTRTGDDHVTQEDENMQVLHVKEIASDGTIILENPTGQVIDSKEFEMATLAVDEEQLPIVLVSGPD